MVKLPTDNLAQVMGLREISELTGIPRRTLQRRARNWALAKEEPTNLGRPRRLYDVATLPPDIRARLAGEPVAQPSPRSLPRRELFVAALNRRLDAGALTYGERSFSRSPGALLGELEQEALDLAGWGFVLWQRIQRARAAAARLASSMPETEPS